MALKLCIIQARLSSTRLPRKVLLPICGKPILWHVIERIKRCKLIDQIVVAFPINEIYTQISKITDETGVNLFLYRGRINDLVGRHVSCAKKYKAHTVIRIPSDNPLIEPSEVDRIIEYHHNDSTSIYKYLYSNNHNINGNGYPDGIGAEVYNGKFLEWIKDNVKGYSEEEEHPHKICFDLNKVKTIECPEDIRRPDLRLDINDQKDYEFITEIYEALYPDNPEFGIRDIIAYFDRKQKDKSLAAQALAKPLYRESILNDLFNKIRIK